MTGKGKGQRLTFGDYLIMLGFDLAVLDSVFRASFLKLNVRNCRAQSLEALLIVCVSSLDSEPLPLDQWHTLQIDDSRTQFDLSGHEKIKAWFGIGIGDLTSDGLQDIVCGKWFYRNPGGDMSTEWPRIELGWAMDAILILDVDKDTFGDAIALREGKQYWLEAKDIQGNQWDVHEIGAHPICNHGISSMGYETASICTTKDDIILSSEKNGLYIITIPEDPSHVPWPSICVTENRATEKGLAVSDVDNDGDLDILTAYSLSSRQVWGDERGICWFENPGEFKGNWTRHIIGRIEHKADRFEAADVNGDGLEDLVVTEGRWPGDQPDASLYWFAKPDQRDGLWEKHTIATAYSINGLSTADMDDDGDIDLVVGEHKGPLKRLFLFENDGEGNFQQHLIDQGKETHMGARVSDMDADGDYDIVSFGYDDFEDLYLWRNDAL